MQVCVWKETHFFLRELLRSDNIRVLLFRRVGETNDQATHKLKTNNNA